MKKIIFISLLFSFSVVAANSDSINLNSEVSPACDVLWTAESVASNLDLVNSQTDLLIGRLTTDTNTVTSSYYQTSLTLDFADHLTHTANSNYIFSLDHLKIINQEAVVYDPFPIGAPMTVSDIGDGYGDMYLSYFGVPALSLVQGTYSATWYASCSVEPRI